MPSLSDASQSFNDVLTKKTLIEDDCYNQDAPFWRDFILKNSDYERKDNFIDVSRSHYTNPLIITL
jgi:hypothetical protein